MSVPKMVQLLQRKDNSVWGLGEDGYVYELNYLRDATTLYWRKLPMVQPDDV